MSLVLVPPLPTIAPLLQIGPDGKSDDYMSTDWLQLFFSVVQRINLSSQVVTNPIPSLTSQGASIAPTQFPIGGTLAGVYRLSWYARITRAASSSSSLTINFAWNDGAAQSGGGAAITGNTTTTLQAESVIVRTTASSALTYGTTYASVGGTSMLYALTVSAEYLGS